MAVDLTVVVLTYNEEPNLPSCLQSVEALDCDVFVVDSGSTDRTIEIAEAAGAQTVIHEFHTQAQQLNWALDHLPIMGRWVFRLDADERVTPELADELRHRLSASGDGISGLYLKRRVYFMGRWMRHGGFYPTWLLRVWERGSAKAEDRLMDEHMVLEKGQAAFLEHDIVENNRKGLFHWVERQNRYATREAEALTGAPRASKIQASLLGTPVARRRWLYERVYVRIPMFLRAFVYFAYRYIFLLGFLDGRRGFVFHFLRSCWYRFQVDAYILESRLNGSQSRPPADVEGSTVRSTKADEGDK